jgi:hypothetical protein
LEDFLSAILAKSPIEVERELAEFVGEFYADPLGYARAFFPWGEPGLLAKLKGPCPCQVKVLTVLGEAVRERRFNGKDAVKPIRIAVSSGHGIGKSILFGIIDKWIKDTRPHSQGTATANTYTQLETKTWAAIQSMAKLSLTAHWFEIGANRIYRKGAKETWFSSPQSCSEENSEAFAGQHSATSTSYYLNDECSAIADIIFEVQEGGLTDGESMQFLFGNQTRSTGKFHRVMSGAEGDRYIRITIDSRECPLTNKEQIQEWITDYGEDSDFVRVRVRGLAPNASDSQFIPQDLVLAAQKRNGVWLRTDPLIAGVDLSWGGSDFNTVRFRRGMDAKSIPPVRIPGELTRDPNVMVMKLAEILDREYDGARVSMMFIDSAGICGPVANRLRELGYKNIQEVNFGAHSLSPKYAFMRSYMWGQMKEALQSGLAIDSSKELLEDLTAPGYALTSRTEVLLEKKEKIRERIGHSVDDGDSLCLTFSAKVKIQEKHMATVGRPRKVIAASYMGG